MLKNLLKKSVYTAVTATLLSAATLTAQTTPTIYWGAGHTNGLIDSVGRFTADANGSIDHLGWTLDANATHALAKWAYTTTGASNGTASLSWINSTTHPAGTMTSPSISTGAIMFDSEGISEAIGDTDSDQGAHLISPVIDLSAAAGQFVAIKLYTNFLNFYSDTLAVELSTDGGNTYTGTDILVETGQSAVRGSHNGWVSFIYPNRLSNIPLELLNCRLRIRYYGNYYYFAFDDISIVTAPNKDLAIATPFDDGTLGATYSTFRVSNSQYMPLSQVSSADSTQFLFGAKLASKGAEDITANDGAKLHVRIDYNDNGSWMTVHSDFLDVESLANNADPADAVFVEEFNNNWRPTSIGEYKVTYDVMLTGTNPDEVEGNNSASHTFFITENYFSKVPTNATTNRPSISQGIFPSAGAAGNKVSEFEYGTMFFFPTTASGKKYAVDSISYSALLSRATSANFNNTVNMRISKFRDLDGNGRISESPTSGELSLVGIGEGTITASVSSTSNVSAAGVITTVSNLTDMGKVAFDHDELYLVTFSCSNPNGLYINSLYNTYLPGAYGINYGLNAAFCDAAPSPARIKVISSNNAEVSNAWNWIGFGADLAPSIGLHLSEYTDISVEDIANEAANFSVFPNPASDVINVGLTFETATTAQIIMTDVTGRVVRLQTQKDAMNENLSFNVADLSAGVYFISVKTEAGVSTQRFVKK